MQRIPSGVTDQLIYFFMVDATDLKTPETGLSGFTVYRSRNGGTATVYTTPTVTQLDATNMPGWYKLLVDEDTTIDSGDHCQMMALHITASGAAPAKVIIELYRPDVTAGTTALVDANGRVDVIKVAGTTQTARDIGASVLLSTGTGTGQLDFTAGVVKANATQILGTAVSTPATAGILDVNLKNIANAAVSTSTAQLGVNAVQAGATAWGSGAITAASIAADAFTAAKFASDVTTELQTGLATASALSTVSGKIDVIDDFLDTEIAAIKAKTDNLPSDPADASDIAASFTTVNGKLDTIDDFLDTEVAAIKAKTDNLPSDPADASDIAAAFGTVNSTLGTIAGYIDTEITTLQTSVNDLPTNAELATALGTADDAVLTQVALVKAVTDKIDTALELDGAVYRYTTNALEQAPTGGSAPTASAIADEVQTRTIAAVTLVNGLAANTVNAAALAADAVAEIQSGLATSSGTINANIVKVNNVTVNGTGAPGSEWGP